jgi:hypothetical protein
MGLDLVGGKTVNNLKAGVVEPSMSKVKSLKFATEAAITILRIVRFAGNHARSAKIARPSPLPPPRTLHQQQDDFIKISPPQAQQ